MVLKEQRDNDLVGYGLVMGLQGTGDHFNGCPPTLESYVSMLERMGINIRKDMEKTRPKNVAAVMVIARLGALTSVGSSISVDVASAGDAKSLQGGILLPTPLVGADGKIYVVAQGSVAVGGYRVDGANGSYAQKNITTRGSIPNGGLVERSVENVRPRYPQLHFRLKNPDWTTAQRVVDVIKKEMNCQAIALDHANINVDVPHSYMNKIPQFISLIEQLRISPDHIARIVINESTGAIVISDHVRIRPCIIAIGDTKITVRERKSILRDYGKIKKDSSSPLPWPSSINPSREDHEKLSSQEIDFLRQLKAEKATLPLSEKIPGMPLPYDPYSQTIYPRSYKNKDSYPHMRQKKNLEVLKEHPESMASDIFVEEDSAHGEHFAYIRDQADIQDLIFILNQIGKSPQEIIQVIVVLNRAQLIDGEVVFV